MTWKLNKNLRFIAWAALALPFAVPAQPLIPGVHPSFTITSLRPAGFNPQVSGLDFLPNGDLVVSTWEGFGTAAGGPGRVFILKNAQTGNAALITYSTFATNMNEPLGLKVVNGEIYLIDKDSLSQLVDANKDEVLDSKRRIAGGWSRNPTDNTNKDLQFALGMAYTPAPDNRFIVGLATRWFNGGLYMSTAERGCIVGMSLTSTTFSPIACGIRTPNGEVIGPEDGIFVTDNQGNYVPGSKLLHIKQGRFFGVLKSQPSPFETAAVTPPVVWMPHGTDIDNVAVSPTQPVYLTSGIFAQQMIVGDNVLGSLKRISLEKVNGEYQGAVFRFSGGLQAGVNRIIVGPDGALYLGGIGADAATWGGWNWNNQLYGLQRMAENTAPVFDVLGVRSTGTTSFAIDFTEPVAAAVASNFTAQQWSYSPALAYGCCRNATQALTVQSAAIGANRLSVDLTINGLTRYDVIYVRFTGITAVSGRTLWTDRFWYTLNNFGPGVPVKIAEDKALRGRPDRWNTRVAVLPGGRLRATWNTGVEQAEVLSLDGRTLEIARDLRNGNGRWESGKSYGRGVYLLRLGNGQASITQRVVTP